MSQGRIWPPNPYDFSGPASKEHFAGRRAEKEVIGHFLRSISDTATAHLLIHGRRGIGKTSLLGQVERDAVGRGLVVARVTLDLTTTKSRAFFPEVVRQLAMEVVQAGGFGGPEGAYARSLELPEFSSISTDDSPGPLRVLRWDVARPESARIPDAIIHADLTELADAAREVDRLGLLLVVDEGDLLTREEETVQRFRNSLILNGVLSTVIAGTDALVSAVDGQSVPIGRHFRRMNLPPLVDISETSDCLARPLQEVGLRARSVLSSEVVRAVHALTAGRPFEVALLGHAMYEEMVARGGEKLELDEAVLDIVIDHLAPSPEDQVALALFRTLEPDDIGLVARYCVDPQPSLKEHALLRIALHEPTLEVVDAARAAVLDDWRQLGELRLATNDGVLLTPLFSELSQTYLKYRARRLGVFEETTEGRFTDRLSLLIQAAITERLEELDCAVGVYLHRAHANILDGKDQDVVELTTMYRAGRYAEFATSINSISDLPFEFTLPAGLTVYWMVGFMPFEVGEDGFSHAFCMGRRDEPVDTDRFLTIVAETFKEAAAFGVALGQVDFILADHHTWRLLGAASAAKKMGEAAKGLWYAGRRDRALELMQEMSELIHADVMNERQLLEPNCVFLSDLAFMELAAGRMVEAATHFEQVATRGGLSPTTALMTRTNLLCNLAAANAGMGRYVEALDWAEQCLALKDSAEDPDFRTGVLAVYIPDPDWPRSPLLAQMPNPFDVAAATRAGALAQIGDESAIDRARACAANAGTAWACDLLEKVGERLHHPELVEEAERCRANVRRESAESPADGDNYDLDDEDLGNLGLLP